jgi:hypothetical protein
VGGIHQLDWACGGLWVSGIDTARIGIDQSRIDQSRID